MVLYKLDEYFPDYRQTDSDDLDIKDFAVYAQGDDKVGSAKNILVDQDGQFRYFIVDTGFWVFGKNILLPVGMAQIDYIDKQIRVPDLTKQQVEDLPEFTEGLAIDNDYEERVRGVFRPMVGAGVNHLAYSPESYTYRQEPYFYDHTDSRLRQYETRLVLSQLYFDGSFS